eukprot:CAMPEP_0175124836 /NCGR_PEP_ID=MMETSP0087-20121206/2994_1 /TAXON_ID=136419 /ORGANISM="Unknown Unknown, Strain D1" /LENGTH=426 /DNA_ID=CAMNT_0016406631 /DNA_START=140 /DNA_END=1424 /DNA_ORIENTATION=-
MAQRHVRARLKSTLHGSAQNPANPAVIKALVEKYWTNQRFRQKPVRYKWFWPYWVDSDFNIDNHFIVHNEPYNQIKLEALLVTFLTTPFSLDKPMWELHCFTHYDFTDNGEKFQGTLILMRFHHCMMDGITCLKVVLKATERITQPPEPKRGNRPKISKLSSVLKIPKTIGYLLTLREDDESPLHSQSFPAPNTPITVRYSRNSVSLPLVKKVAHASGCTVNDVMLAGCAGALNDFLAAVPKDGNQIDWNKKVEQISAAIWVSLIPLNLQKDGPVKWGNFLGTVMTKLPVNCSDHGERLKLINQQVKALIGSPEPLISSFLFRLFGLLPFGLCRPLWQKIAYKMTASISSIPGPSWQLSYAGQAVDRIVCVMPPAGNIGVFLTIFSYYDKVTFCVSGDTRLIEDTLTIVENIDKNIKDTARALGCL